MSFKPGNLPQFGSAYTDASILEVKTDTVPNTLSINYLLAVSPFALEQKKHYNSSTNLLPLLF